MPPFTPDSRNLGGRNLITQQIWNHLQQLQQIHQASPQLLISPGRSAHSPKPNSVEPQLKQSQRKKQDYLLYPTFLFRRKTVSESFTPSLSPKPRHGNDETQLLFQDPVIRRPKASKKQQQRIFPFSTVQMGMLYKVKANDIKLHKKDNESIMWGDVESQLSGMQYNDYDTLYDQLQQLIHDYGIYSADDYQGLIGLLMKVHPYISRVSLLTIFNELITKQQLKLL